ncbi:GNAT family N-acetyltransferase [Rhodothermus profundi]|uniref:Diamine N-acetyltransferase n=1 Tax=Rhodothermus profundi TaxID=633813 RepID=A0A1M6RHR0_9BACT|nr:GNAT family N-acetyltransferase [Rhodothermus profundi]SHK31897.1 diamine N-acetyltransferase [Rhodothermus profundi]
MSTHATETTFRIRMAEPDDAETLVQLILELADYERLRQEARPNPEALRAHLHPEASPRCEALLAEDSATGEVVGFALFFANYSTFLTRWGIHLEDIYVRPAYRGRGIGFALLKRVAEIAVARGAQRLEWQVLDWNEPALRFYHRLGARPMRQWITMRLSGEALERLGRREEAP